MNVMIVKMDQVPVDHSYIKRNFRGDAGSEKAPSTDAAALEFYYNLRELRGLAV
jgi:hypothetical protein